MITFKSFLSESPKEDAKTAAFNEWWETVELDCKEILKVYKKIFSGPEKYKFLFRGVSGANNYLNDKVIHQDRRPVEMPPIVHTVINEVSEKHGFPAHRGNSIFCSNNLSIARSWGHPFIVFPIDPFKYTWFNGQQETYMYNTWMDESESIMRQFIIDNGIEDGDIDRDEYLPYLKKNIDEIFMSYEPQKTNLDKCLTSRDVFDILITGESYHACSWTKLSDVAAKLK